MPISFQEYWILRDMGFQGLNRLEFLCDMSCQLFELNELVVKIIKTKIPKDTVYGNTILLIDLPPLFDVNLHILSN